ncbi:HEAT repeat domain-containing protein [Brevundimonas sp. S30B]|uniref:HEAT repeat domain-containing protein n=1 Tax=unclassified Brevundimonas TaxID=2622653 RepID=UPI0010724F66|nr:MULTISPECIES: HEAT repeat domain-containing protein [unclassified Brevundimonas]QBX38093.1 HEAT repeat domain-containing protein [Brevundimonas sp. MF30-B]TFW02553.1 HEAT repeat domain-containing protein [Brevundimonas sp. S30B]
MSGLQFIWTLSVALAAFALAWMAALIMARVFRERSAARRERNRRLIHQAFLDIMAGSGDAIGRLRSVRQRARTMAEALLGVMALVRGAERDRLIRVLDAFGVQRSFEQRLSRGSLAGRLAAAEALSIFPGRDTAVTLRRALDSTRSVELRASLMRSLIDLGAPPDLETVLDDLGRRGGSESLVYAPLIGSIVQADPLAGLEAFAGPALASEGRLVLAEALGRSGDYRVLETLCLAARAADTELRIAALRGLAALGHPAAQPAVLEGLEDPVWMVRSAACEASGRIGLRAAIPRLADQLGDPMWWVRFRAGEALWALGEPGRAQLHRSLAEGCSIARRTASMVLAEHGPRPKAA